MQNMRSKSMELEPPKNQTVPTTSPISFWLRPCVIQTMKRTRIRPKEEVDRNRFMQNYSAVTETGPKQCLDSSHKWVSISIIDHNN